MLSFLSGSHAFNLATPTSDVDAFGVYAARTSGLLSLRPAEACPDVVDGKAPVDYAMYEARTYARLLLKGNPKVVEPLFSDKMCWRAPMFEELVSKRGVFLNKVTLRQYLGYAEEKLRNASKPETEKNVPKKQMYHALRLSFEAQRICNGGQPNVFLEGEDREQIMAIRRGAGTPDELQQASARVRSILVGIEAKLPSCGLPEAADPNVLDQWLWRLYNVDRVVEVPQPLPEDPRVQRVASLLQSKGLDGSRLVFVGLSGSHLHGLSSGGAPDLVALFEQPLRRAVSLEPCSPSYSDQPHAGPSFATTSPGVNALELGYGLSAAFSGNHRVLECMFAPEASWVLRTDAWNHIVQNRDLFLSKAAMKHLLGLSEGQLKAAESAMRCASSSPEELRSAQKRLSHSARLTDEAGRVVKHEPLKVVVEGPLRETLLRLRSGSATPEEALAVADSVKRSLAELREAAKSMHDTAQASESAISEWLASSRLSAEWVSLTTPKC
eukprot:m51a1_g4968 hypothetical protein (497) ;mRNA; r:389804-391537